MRAHLVGDRKVGVDAAALRHVLRKDGHVLDELDEAARGALGLQQLGDVELGVPREFVWGFVMGFVLGFIMLFWLWERSVSHRQKMGILTGVTAQLSMKFVRARLAEEGELRGAGAAAAVSDADAALPPAIGS